MLFGLFPQFRLESTGPMCFLTGCFTKTLDIGTSLLQCLPFFVHLRVDHRRLRKTMIDVNGLITNDKFCLSRTAHLHLGYCRLPDHMKQALAAPSGYPSHKDVSSCQGGPHETTPVEDHTPT